MIRLTRLNGKEFVLNCDLIKSIESTPDTVITLTQGEKLMVREDVETILNATMSYRQKIYQDPLSSLFRSDSRSEGSGSALLDTRGQPKKGQA